MAKNVDSKKLKSLLIEAGEGAKVRLVVESKLSFSTIEKLCSGNYPSPPRQRLRQNLCSGLEKLLKRKISESEVFPVAAAKGRAS